MARTGCATTVASVGEADGTSHAIPCSRRCAASTGSGISKPLWMVDRVDAALGELACEESVDRDVAPGRVGRRELGDVGEPLAVPRRVVVVHERRTTREHLGRHATPGRFSGMVSRFSTTTRSTSASGLVELRSIGSLGSSVSASGSRIPRPATGAVRRRRRRSR